MVDDHPGEPHNQLRAEQCTDDHAGIDKVVQTLHGDPAANQQKEYDEQKGFRKSQNSAEKTIEKGEGLGTFYQHGSDLSDDNGQNLNDEE